MNAVQVLTILKARWAVMLAVLLASVGLAAAISLQMSREYRASATVVIEGRPDPVSVMAYGGMNSPAFVATQVDILRSDRVALRVVRNLKLAENPDVRASCQQATGGQGAVETWMASALLRQLDVQPSRESSVIVVSYKAPDARFAAALANAFVQAFVETSLELRVDPARQYSSFFEQRSREAREALEAAQARLSEFQQRKGLVATDERLDVEMARLNEISSQLVALQAIAGESATRDAQARGGAGDRMQEVLSNPLIANLRADLSRAEARLKELSSRLGDAHPQVLEARAAIDSLQSRIAEETRRVTGGVGVTSSINRQREVQVRAELDAQRARVLQMRAVRDEGAVLVRDVENAQRAFDAIVTRLTQTSLESQTTQSHVTPLTPASPPLQPSSPRVVLNLVAATFVGTLLALALALGLEWRDRRVRSAEDLVLALDLPVIGVMPKPAHRVEARRRPALAMKERLVRTLPGRRAPEARS